MSRDPVCDRCQRSTVPPRGPKSRDGRYLGVRSTGKGDRQKRGTNVLHCSQRLSRKQSRLARDMASLQHHLRHDALLLQRCPTRLWSTMTEMPKVLRVSRFVWPCPALPAMGPVRAPRHLREGPQRQSVAILGHPGRLMSMPLCRPPLASSDGPWTCLWLAPPLAPSSKAVSIPSPSCVLSVSCLVSEFHTHSPCAVS